jgi:hypothetical protein
MSKLVIPNIPNHYEGSGFEVDVTPMQIIVRNKNEPERKEQQRERQRDPAIGPVSSGILKKIGLLR